MILDPCNGELLGWDIPRPIIEGGGGGGGILRSMWKVGGGGGLVV